MSDEHPKPRPGTIGWCDLSVPDAAPLRDFYRAVVGWETSEVDMCGYSDYGVHPPGGGDMLAGICHARGANAGLPPAWLVYITVADLDAAIAACRALGGEVISGPREMAGQGRYCVIRDPAGAAAALYQPLG
jgi:predicted enzyme related to lactoylglutathione lyase